MSARSVRGPPGSGELRSPPCGGETGQALVSEWRRQEDCPVEPGEGRGLVWEGACRKRLQSAVLG